MVNGTLIWYYHICTRQVWFMGHAIEPEQEDERVRYGKTLSEIVFRRVGTREVSIDNRIKIDLVKGGVIMEVKKSSKYEKASLMQLAYYLYYLKKEKGISVKGVLLFPEERRRVNVSLDENLEREIERVIDDVKAILNMPVPPPPVKKRYCRKCAFRYLCWA